MSKNLLVGMACALLLAGAGLALLRQRRPAPAPRANSETEQFLALERAALGQDNTTWAQEVEALRLGGQITAFWDELRHSSNAWPLLRQIEFRELHFPAPKSERTLGDGITQRLLDGESRIVPGAAWPEFVQSWEQGGFELIQSEWRQIAFALAPDSHSVFEVELHLLHRPGGTRHQVKFQLSIDWEQDHLGTLRVEHGTVLSQSGPPRFSPWFQMELPLTPGLETLDPWLGVYDLNRDGRPEIALAVPNLVLRPKASRFAPEDLCAVAPDRPRTALFGDFDNDGTVDYLCATLDALLLYRGAAGGTFPDAPATAWKPGTPLSNPFVLSSGDIDRDGDLDLFLGQYKLPFLTGQMPTPFYDANDGFPSFLLVNDGSGAFRERTGGLGLDKKQRRRTYSASFIDLDRDADLDLIAVSDFAGLDLYLNDGAGRFADATARLVPEPHAFGMAHALADFDLDGAPDILMIGMDSDTAARLEAAGLDRPGFPAYREMRGRMTQGNRLYSFGNGVWRDRARELNIARAGWGWGVTVFDADGDSDPDVYIANGHNSRATAMDYETQFWRHDIYVGRSEPNPAAEKFFQAFAGKIYGAGWSYGGYHKNKLFLNQGGTNFIEAGFLAGVALEKDCRNVVSADLDGDGDRDLILTTLEQWPILRQELKAFRNDSPGPGKPPPAAPYVTGDSYRSQHPLPPSHP